MKWNTYDPDSPPDDGDYLLQLHNGDYIAAYLQNDTDTDPRTGRDYAFASITAYHGGAVDADDVQYIAPIFPVISKGVQA